MFNFVDDITFVIPVKIDTEERTRNLEINLEYIRKHMDVNVIVSEMDFDGPKAKELSIKHKCRHLYTNIKEGRLYNYNKALNIGARQVKTPLMAKVDVDCIITPEQWERTIFFLKRDKADMIYPFDGTFYNIHRCQIDTFREHLDINRIDWRELSCWSRESVGGIQAYRLDSFYKYGMVNEAFEGWGFEDNFQKYIYNAQGARILRTQCPIWHLDHWRNDGEFYGNNANNEALLNTMLTFTKEQYEQYLKVAPWMPGNHPENIVILENHYR